MQRGFRIANGGGTLSITADNTYTGSTTISGTGTNLVVNGSIGRSSLVTVDAGATLRGTGTIGSLSIASGGVFAPGSGIPGGAMTVAGNLAFDGGSTFVVALDPMTAAMANVTGSASLNGGAVVANYVARTYLAKQYTILSASGGLGGTRFSGLASTSLPAGFHETLSYGPNAVYLNLVADLGAINGGSPLGLPRNQLSVADGLNRYFNAGGPLPQNFVGVFGLNGASLVSSLSQLSGEATTAAPQTAFIATNRFLDLIFDPSVAGREEEVENETVSAAPLAYAEERPPLLSRRFALAHGPWSSEQVAKSTPTRRVKPAGTVWASAFGGHSNLSGDQTGQGSRAIAGSLFGVASGVDCRPAPETTIGVALAGGGSDWSLAQGLGGGHSDSLQVGLYGSQRVGVAYVAGAFAFAEHWLSTGRRAPLGYQLSADFSAQNYASRIELGLKTIALNGLAPYVSAQNQIFVTPCVTERDQAGAGFALTYAGRSFNDARAEAGVRFDRALGLFAATSLSLRGRAAFAHDWVGNAGLAAAFSVLPGASFKVKGARPGPNAALISIGPELHLIDGAILFARFDGEFSANGRTVVGRAGLRYNW